MPGKDIGDDTGMDGMEMDGSPAEIAVAPGEPVRLRVVNAGTDTLFADAVGGARWR